MIDLILEFFIRIFTYKANAVYAFVDPATATLISAGIGLFSSSRSRRDAKRRAAEALKRQQEQQEESTKKKVFK